jgi:hypothetical protein
MSLLKRLFGGEREAPETVFWNWFVANAARYHDFTPGSPEQAGLFRDLDRALGRVHRGLQFAFDGGGNAEREFIISADGNRELFPAVQRLVDAAPEIPGWRIIAFRPRMASLDDISLEIPGVKIEAKTLWYGLASEGDKIGIALFLPGFEDVRSQPALMVALLMLDSALGEYDVETRVGSITTFPPQPDPVEARLKPFPTLPTEFDALYRLMTER